MAKPEGLRLLLKESEALVLWNMVWAKLSKTEFKKEPKLFRELSNILTKLSK